MTVSFNGKMQVISIPYSLLQRLEGDGFLVSIYYHVNPGTFYKPKVNNNETLYQVTLLLKEILCKLQMSIVGTEEKIHTHCI